MTQFLIKINEEQNKSLLEPRSVYLSSFLNRTALEEIVAPSAYSGLSTNSKKGVFFH